MLFTGWNLRKQFRSVFHRFYDFLKFSENLRKSSEAFGNLRKFSENFGNGSKVIFRCFYDFLIFFKMPPDISPQDISLRFLAPGRNPSLGACILRTTTYWGCESAVLRGSIESRGIQCILCALKENSRFFPARETGNLKINMAESDLSPTTFTSSSASD